MPKQPIPFILLDGSQTTKEVRVLVSGVDTTQFERNPVMFYRHADYELPIGTWTNIRKENGVLLADAVLDYEDTDKEVQRIIGKIERKVIRMASCGLVDLDVVDDPMYRVPGETDYTVIKSRLREASILPIGGNHNALRLFDKEGNEIELGEGPGLKLSDFIVKPKIEIMDKELLTLLNLSDTATPVEQIEKVQLLLSDKLKAENELAAEKLKVAAFEQKEVDDRKAESLSLVDAAVLDGRIDAKGKASFLNLFDKDFEAGKTALGAIPARPTLKDQMEKGEKPELETLSLMDWNQLDKAGKLEHVKLNFNDLYVEKFKAKFNTEPKK